MSFFSCHQFYENCLLRVQAIFSLLEDNRVRAIGHIIGNLIAAMRGQAMHDDHVVFGSAYKLRVDLKGAQQLYAPISIIFLAHAHPGISIDYICRFDGSARIVEHFDSGIAAVGTGAGGRRPRDRAS